MIRDRLHQDLAPLARVLDELDWPPGSSSAQERLTWLHQPAAELSWVFDAAPVNVTPTGNVLGHLQVVRPGESDEAVVALTGREAADLLLIGRLFVRPVPHADGIRNFLLTQAVRSVRARGRIAVLDLAANPGLTEKLCHRRGFRQLPAAVPGTTPMMHQQDDAGGTA